MAKAYFAPFPEMARRAGLIAVVDIVALKPAAKSQDKTQARDWLAEAEVKEVIAGSSAKHVEFYIKNFFPCAVVSVSTGTYLVVLSSNSTIDKVYTPDAAAPRDGLYNSNWSLSMRRVSGGLVDWPEEGKDNKPHSIPLSTARSRIITAIESAPENAKKLIPSGGVLAEGGVLGQAYIHGADDLWRYPLVGWGKAPCLLSEDLDGDGDYEVALVYTTPSIKRSEETSMLAVFKRVGGEWKEQYRLEGEVGVKTFGVARMLRTGEAQVIYNTGLGASAGSQLNIIQYSEGKYKQVLKDAVNGGIATTDFFKNRDQDLLAYERYAALPSVIRWDTTSGMFRVVQDKSFFKDYCRKVVGLIKSPYGRDGELIDRQAWALFDCNFMLGNKTAAKKLGESLLDYSKKQGGAYAWGEDVQSKLKQLGDPKPAVK
jgi:hypothetical protein